MKVFHTALCFFFLLPLLTAQMPQPDGPVRYGHEWIRPNTTYLRIAVAEDGPYRVPAATLAAQGWSVTGPDADRLQLWHMGDSIPIYVSEQGVHFFGEQNRGAFDRYLFSDPDAQQLNPRYSMFTDTAVYYLGLLPVGEVGLRFTEASHDPDSGAPVVPFVWRTSERVFGDFAIKRFEKISGGLVFYSHFDTAEGYGSRQGVEDLQSSNGSTISTLTLEANNAVPAPETATLSLRFGVGFDAHRQVLYLDNVETDSFVNIGWAVHAGQWDVSAATLSDAQLAIKLRGTGGGRDKASVAYAQLRYPAAPSTGGSPFLSFEITASTQPRTLQLEGLPGSGIARLFDRTAGRYYTAPLAGGVARFGLPAFSEGIELALVADAGWQPTARPAQPISFPEVADTPVDFLILTSERLRNAGSAVAEYAAYRGSPAGGGYRVRVITVEDIYERHGYGIARHPQTIRNYLQWVRSEHPELKYLLIIGKGREYRDVRKAGHLASAQETFFVPTFGYPAADNLLSSTDNIYLPTLATGRLTVVDQKELSIYLDKLKETENPVGEDQTITDKAWKKNVIHLGGGSDFGEQLSIRNYLEGMGRLLQKSRFGANLNSLYKTSSDPIEDSRSDRIFTWINEGASLITVFGHASPNTFDINIDNPDNYKNDGKCPFLISLGCYSGNSFDGSRSIGENFLFIPNRGAIAFGATIGVGYTNLLNSLGLQFYDFAGNEYYGEGIGEIMRRTLIELAKDNSRSNLVLTEQYAIQGDPAFRLHPAPGPDYTIDQKSVRLTPEVINVTSDSFDLQYDLVNLGSYRKTDTLSISYELQFANGAKRSLGSKKVPAPAARATIMARLPAPGRDAVGLNRLLIKLDPDNLLPEAPAPQAEQNNELKTPTGLLGIELFVTSNAAEPIYPYPYALIGDPELTFTVVSSNPLQAKQNYLFQLDTTPFFTQPLAEYQIEQIGGILEWQPDFSWQDSTAYYWRVSPDSLQGIGYVWEQRSFTFLADTEPGWGLGHWGQFQDGVFDQMQVSQETGFSYGERRINIRIKNKVYENDDRPFFIFNNESPAGSVRPFNYLDEGIAVVVFQPNTGFNWANVAGGPAGTPGTYGIPTGNSRVFAFNTKTVEQRANLLEFLDEVVPKDHFVFLWTNLKSYSADVHSSEWAADSLLLPQNLFQYLESQGATQVRRLANNGQLPYILIYQKGKGALNEIIAIDQQQTVNAEYDIPQTFRNGSFRSPTIDYSRRWGRLSWSYRNDSPRDANQLIVKGGYSSQEMQDLAMLPAAGELDLSSFSVAEYPLLQLQWINSDSAFRTPPQLDYLHLKYDKLPDITYDGAAWRKISMDTLARGQRFELGIAIRNPTPYALIDSFYVTAFRNDLSGNSIRESRKFRPLPPGDSVHFDLAFDTWNSPDPQQLFVQINPDSIVRESRYDNNLLQRSAAIRDDDIPPLIDITVDGIPIRDGDLVAARPLIRVDLIDENRNLPLDDPSALRLTFIDPEGLSEQLDAADPRLIFTPGRREENRASIEFTPELLIDGLYTLRISAEDRTGNRSGRLDAEVRFNVVNASTISHVVNYPNPFTTSTSFVYELTGSEPPSDYRIQIMTISGRIVRELGPQELGPLRVGRHQTLSWNGEDTYGDRLANGVYLYRFVLNGNSELDTEHRSTALDPFFQNGTGKLVILR